MDKNKLNQKLKQCECIQGEIQENNLRLIHPIIETHCHLDYFKKNDTEEVILKSKEIGIEKFVTISVDSSNIQKVNQLTKDFESVYGSQGIHPHHASEWNNEIKQTIIDNLQNKKIVAIGETGLDYHYNYSPKDQQIKAFEDQLQLAADLNMPVIIHSREAEDDTISILKNFSKILLKKGVLHSFSSKKNLCDYAVSEGFYIGLNGIISFKSATDLRSIISSIPLQNILLETDCPYLTPVPFRGKENAPFYLPFIADIISKEKKIKSPETLKQIYDNSTSLFNFL